MIMKNQYRKIYCNFLTLFLFSVIIAYGQESVSTTKYIEKLIEQDSLSKANTEIAKYTAYYNIQNNNDSLVKLITYVGSFKLSNNNKQAALKKAETLTEIIKKSGEPFAVKEAFRELAWLYANAGDSKKAYTLLEEALIYANRIQDPKKAGLSDIEYSLGHNASVMGNFPLSKKHYKKSLQLLYKNNSDDYVSYQIVYNALGGIMWHEAQLDSSAYYFEESLKVLKKTDANDLLNQYYRPALVKQNLSILMNALGNNQNAIRFTQEAISEFEEYITKATDEGRIFQAKKHQLVGIDNLGSFYNTLGEHKRAQELIEYSYHKKKQLFDENDINIIISLIILSEAKMANLDYDGAAINTDEALKLLKNNQGANYYWNAAALATRATIYEFQKDVENAQIYYEKGEEIYRKSLAGNYTKDFLEGMINMSLFYAKNQQTKKAVGLATEIYDFAKASDFKNTLQEFHHSVNLAEVYYHLKDYENALIYSDEALRFKENVEIGKATSDSILFQYRKPKAILINSKAKYYLQQENDAQQLKDLLEQVESGIAILEQRRKTVTTHEDVSLLVAENTELFNFAKKLRLDLYQKTKEENYLDKVITLHESNMYNKIRTRLNLRGNLSFSHIPLEVLTRENNLKTTLSASLNKTKDDALKSFFEADKQWEIFLDSLKKHFPKYYEMKYASIEESLTGLQQKIPANVTIIRYLFIEDKLYAFIISNTRKEIIELPYASVKNHIAEVNNHSFDSNKISPLLYELYNALWKPFEDKIHTKKIVIIPDRELFNLSFETLTPKPIQSYKELATNSLLAHYVISYNFSLFIVNNKEKVADYSSDFIAFAPGFNTKMKDNYKLGIQDSVSLDKTYLTLLPQPFSEDLVKQFSKTFNGSYFLNENASKEIFTTQANEHKIIHIGTHAESNNISPELSRLIFAKKTVNDTDYNDNSLYTYEIYNINLSSNLAILTACETGKPAHQPGEGMISLAHAFNYAGSESILTSLWKIDEESSTKIIASFYNYLSKGFDKDEALQKAKLDYIATAQGRTISPEYWAGLILIGDTAPIEFTPDKSKYYIAGIILLLLAAFFYIKRKKNNRLLKKTKNY